MRTVKKTINIKRLLSLNMILLLTLVLGTTAIIFSYMEYNNIKKNAISDLGNSCISIGDNIDLQLRQLDTITLNTINSADLSSELQTFVATENNDAYNHIKSRQRLSALLTALKGFDYSVRQLNIYSTSDLGYGVGDYLGTLNNYDDSPWYKNTIEAAGLKHISIGDLDETGALTDGNTYFSISRTYYNSYHQPVGTIEARKYYTEVFKAAIENKSAYSPSIYIYDEKGELLYPLIEDTGFANDLYVSATDPVVEYKTDSFLPDFIFSYNMPNSDYKTILYVEGINFFKPLLSSLAIFIVLFVIIYFVGILAAHVLTNNISTPIRKIYYFLLNKESDNQFEQIKMEPTNIKEIDKLVRSINEYISSSETQTKTMLGLQQQEVQAEMLALQSQMNPHFLYNSLACIEEMAHQGMQDSVATMVKDISSILRSISSNKEQVIPLEEELDLCDMYLECLKYRFGDDLTYEFDVEDTLLDYLVPKLCIQLLVENAIKSTTQTPLPWHICIHGYTEGDNWFIEVKDTGSGFDKEVDIHLRQQMDSILETGILPSLKIEGMGILNIFIRLYLLDGITFLFDFGNNVEGGAFVKIGRNIEKSKPIYS